IGDPLGVEVRHPRLEVVLDGALKFWIRFPVIERALGDAELFRDFLIGELVLGDEQRRLELLAGERHYSSRIVMGCSTAIRAISFNGNRSGGRRGAAAKGGKCSGASRRSENAPLSWAQNFPPLVRRLRAFIGSTVAARRRLPEMAPGNRSGLAEIMRGRGARAASACTRPGCSGPAAAECGPRRTDPPRIPRSRGSARTACRRAAGWALRSSARHKAAACFAAS